MRKILDWLKAWLLRRWWGRNLANIISIGGFIGAYLFLFYFNLSITEKLAGYIAMLPLDGLDGKVARWLKMDDGAGKYIDPVVDKLRNFFALYFLFLNPALVFKIVIGLIFLGEIAVLVPFGIAVCRALKYRRYDYLKNAKRLGWKGFKAIFRDMASEVEENWGVNQDGKTTMICYTLMFVAIFLRSIWMDRDEFIGLYVIFAFVGCYFRFYSVQDYREKFLEWQEKAAAKVAKAG